MYHQSELINLEPVHEFFVGIDSDGCVFDTMEVKQKEFFIPAALEYFDLNKIAAILRETWEYVNLYSVHRGGNRFLSLIKVIDLLKERREVIDSEVSLPSMNSLRQWIKKETKLSNENLRKFYESNKDPDLQKILTWTEAINKNISTEMRRIPPFNHSIEAIETISGYADIVVVSQTPIEALEREWSDHNLKKFVRFIAGQEHGTKAEHLAHAAKGKYHNDKILMIGDAIGDLNAAIKNGILFYPVIPGKEADSWKLFFDEGLKRFLECGYRGNFENGLINNFRESLPELPPWV